MADDSAGVCVCVCVCGGGGVCVDVYGGEGGWRRRGRRCSETDMEMVFSTCSSPMPLSSTSTFLSPSWTIYIGTHVCVCMCGGKGVGRGVGRGEGVDI